MDVWKKGKSRSMPFSEKITILGYREELFRQRRRGSVMERTRDFKIEDKGGN